MYRMRIEELVSTEQQLVMHCADVKSQLTLLLEAKGISALETRVIKQLSFQASVLSVVQVCVVGRLLPCTTHWHVLVLQSSHHW